MKFMENLFNSFAISAASFTAAWPFVLRNHHLLLSDINPQFAKVLQEHTYHIISWHFHAALHFLFGRGCSESVLRRWHNSSKGPLVFHVASEWEKKWLARAWIQVAY
jgi:hypothetical protein